MKEADKGKFAAAMGAMFSVFSVEPTKERLAGYWMGLSDLLIDDVCKAVQWCIGNEDRLATPARIRAVTSGRMDDESRAHQAWLLLNRMIDREGVYRSPDCEDTVLVATIDSLGGWKAICDSTVSDFDRFIRPQFLKTYVSLCRVKDLKPARLVGICEAENRHAGWVKDGESYKLTQRAANGLNLAGDVAGELVRQISESQTTNGRAAG